MSRESRGAFSYFGIIHVSIYEGDVLGASG